MAEREQRQRGGSDRTAEEAEVTDVASGFKSERSARLKGEMDDLLDEIDEVLESNAEEFVKSYIQKGGE